MRESQSSGAPDAGRAAEPIEVRPAQPRDVALMVALYLESARQHALLDPDAYVVPHPWLVNRSFGTRLLRETDRSQLLVAELDGQVVGMLDVAMVPRHPRHSMRRPRRVAQAEVAVAAAHRGRGVGRSLLEAAELWARRREADLFAVEVSARNPAAQRFFQYRLNYDTTGVLLSKPLRGAAARATAAH